MRIYKVTNKVNGKSYIGKTHKHPNIRWRNHCVSALRGNSNYRFANALRKYGVAAFVVTVFKRKFRSEKQLNVAEMYWIRKLKTHDPKYGYNMTFGGEGVIPTDEVRRKISLALTGNSNTPKGRIPWNKGLCLPDATRRKMSVAHKGLLRSNEHCRNLSASLKGNKNCLGNVCSSETKRKIAVGNRGKIRSQETRRKLSIIAKEQWRQFRLGLGKPTGSLARRSALCLS
jgi:group I intron endonuclease